MAEDYEQYLADLEKKYGTTSDNRASDLERLRGTNPDDVQRVKDAYESQYERRGSHNTDDPSSEVYSAMGYGSARNETADDRPAPGSPSGGWGSVSGSSSQQPLPGQPDYTKYFDQQQAILAKMQADAEARNAAIAAREAEDRTKRDALYGTLMGRSQQALNINGNDPIIKGQVDQYRNAQTRAQRDDLSDLAERSGPLANLRGEQRMAAERSGQNTAGFQAELLGRELSTRRGEISDALRSMGGMLSADQQANLQRELDNLDNQLGQVQTGMTGSLQYGGLQNELMRAMMQNQQFYSGLGSENDRFAATHGLNVADRSSYWDALRRGLL